MNRARYEQAATLRAGGSSVPDIAQAMGVSRQRVWQMLARVEEAQRRAAQRDPLDLLSARARNGLRHEFLFLRQTDLTVEGIATALADGRLGSFRNIGDKTIEEIAAWLEAVKAAPSPIPPPGRLPDSQQRSAA